MHPLEMQLSREMQASPEMLLSLETIYLLDEKRSLTENPRQRPLRSTQTEAPCR